MPSFEIWQKGLDRMGGAGRLSTHLSIALEFRPIPPKFFVLRNDVTQIIYIACPRPTRRPHTPTEAFICRQRRQRFRRRFDINIGSEAGARKTLTINMVSTEITFRQFTAKP